MICYNCDGRYNKKHGTIHLNDEIIGKYKVPDVDYYVCDKCVDVLYPVDTLKVIEIIREQIEDKLIKERPLKDFISASKTLELLGISRQALHKNRRIRRGFIFKTKIDGSDFYLKESVLKYKETGDGRFPLSLTDRQDKKEIYAEIKVIRAKKLPQASLTMAGAEFERMPPVKLVTEPKEWHEVLIAMQGPRNTPVLIKKTGIS